MQSISMMIRNVGCRILSSDDSYLRSPVLAGKTYKTLTSPNSSFEIFYRQNKAVLPPSYSIFLLILTRESIIFPKCLSFAAHGLGIQQILWGNKIIQIIRVKIALTVISCHHYSIRQWSRCSGVPGPRSRDWSLDSYVPELKALSML